MEKELHNDIDERSAFDAAAIASDTTTVGNIIDTAAHESLEFIMQLGTVTTGDFTLLLEESDDSGLAGSNVVAAADILGALVVTTASDQLTRVGYVGKKRYVRASIVSDNTGIIDCISVVAILGHPKHAPVAQ